jgi:amino acid permease
MFPSSDFVTGVATHFVDGASGGTKQFLEIFDDRKYVILIIGGVVVLPLLFLKNLNALRFTSLMGVVSILFSGSVVCYFAFHNDSPKVTYPLATDTNTRHTHTHTHT